MLMAVSSSLGFLLLLDFFRLREKCFADLRKQLLKAQVETTLEGVITHDSLVERGENDTATLSTGVSVKELRIDQDELRFVFNFDFISFILIDFASHDFDILLLALWDQLSDHFQIVTLAL
jgi:hypothetical protein